MRTRHGHVAGITEETKFRGDIIGPRRHELDICAECMSAAAGMVASKCAVVLNVSWGTDRSTVDAIGRVSAHPRWKVYFLPQVIHFIRLLNTFCDLV